ncbi:hypothetical protein WJX81_003413 [Elliptochloris bilobata]|uniref:Spore protein YkvP/CgeB glycosyl transferase-like domain-containing protein n=1 Tax=Elliptochloris bilobata TaxID=381761 RepID=A0AAW1RFT0_9CHLO
MEGCCAKILGALLAECQSTDGAGAGQVGSAALHVSGRLRQRDHPGTERNPVRGRGGRECVIRAYVAEYLNYEFPYLFHRVLGGIAARCGCWLRVLPRAQLLRDAVVSHALIVSGTNSDAWPSFAADIAMVQHNTNLSTVGLVHLGDEHLVDDVSRYGDFAFVLRNYLRDGLPPGAAVTWFPLGYGHMLLAGAAALRQPASVRRLLWSWSGSVQRKPDREAFLAALRSHARWPELNASGYLETFDFFNANQNGLASTGAMYTGLLHDSVFVPCPRGRSAEQFRIWEALESGAMPIVLMGEPALAYLVTHSLTVPQLGSWAELPDFLLEQQARPPAELDAGQAALQDAYRRLMRRQTHGAQNIALPLPLPNSQAQIRLVERIGTGPAGTRRSIESFSEVHIWSWRGIYHQAREVARVLRPHYKVTGNDWQAPDEALHGALFIILAAHLMPRFPPHYVVYQTEQWGHQVLAEGNRAWGPPHNGTQRVDCAEVFRNAVEVWDYSQRHIAQWRQRFSDGNVPFRYVPFAWFPAPQVNHTRKDIDILFYGWLLPNSHREQTIRALEAHGLAIKVANVDTFEEGLTELLLRTRIVLNIHFYQARVLEMCRIMEAVSLGALVVTERGVDHTLDDLWADKVAFAEGVDELADRLRFFLADERQRRARVEHAAAYARAAHDLSQTKRGTRALRYRAKLISLSSGKPPGS